MDDEPTTDDQRVADRSELLPEEQAAGSEDPEGQARAVLAESDERTETRDEPAPDRQVEHRSSEEAAQ
jgi:hypothetical protein